ncbi:MAG: type II secretion system F family protein [Devosia sp.]|nr:type II secretion system F family protein [Devosia sp.]
MSDLILPIVLTLLAAAAFLGFAFWRPVPRDVRKRVDATIGATPTSSAQLAQPRSSSLRKRIEGFRHLFILGLDHSWGVHATAATLLLIGLIAGSGVWLLTRSLLGLPLPLALLLSAAAFWIAPNRFAAMQQDRADRAFLDLFPDAIDMIVRVLRAGLPVNAAIRTVAHDTPPPLSEIFTAVADQVDIGITFEDALGISSDRTGLADYRFFAAAVGLQRKTGGNLITALEILVDMIRRRRTVRLKAKAATAEERTSAYVLAAMPFIIIAGLLAVNPAYLMPLLTDSRGNIILIVAAVMLGMAFLTMRYLMRWAVRT